ncbi:MAG: hypothetical protein E7616_07770 [Ruminococcaceae bacterium]|nr:hypothetical protein [Oscillospiraceae bacterium]
MQNSKFKQTILIIATLLLGFLLFNNWVFPLIMTVSYAIFGSESTIAPIAAVCIANLLVGIVSVLPFYWSMRDSGEERRNFYSYFQDKNYNRKELGIYFRTAKIIKTDVIIYTVSLLLVLLYKYLPSAILISPIYLIDIVLAFVLIYGIFIIYEFIIRPKMYDKWYADRMHK